MVIDAFVNRRPAPQIADVLLPYIADRALTRVRFPDGVAGPSFYAKNAPAGTPSWVTPSRKGRT